MGLLDVEPAARAALPPAVPRGLHQQQVLPPALPLAEPPELGAAHAGVPRHAAPRAEQPPARLALRLRHARAPLVVGVGDHHLGAARVRQYVRRAPRTWPRRRRAPPLEHVPGSAPRHSSGSSAPPHDGSGQRTAPAPPPDSTLARTWPARHARQKACAQPPPPWCASEGGMGSMQMPQLGCCCRCGCGCRRCRCRGRCPSAASAIAMARVRGASFAGKDGKAFSLLKMR